MLKGLEKAAVALGVSLLVWFSTAFTDGHISAGEWAELAGAFATSLGVYVTPNSSKN